MPASTALNAFGGQHSAVKRSKIRREIDIFVSHVWAAHPRARWLGLVWHLNARSAVVAALAASILAAVILMWTVDGRGWVKVEDASKLTVYSILSLFGTCVLFLVFFLSPGSLPGTREKSCFLDSCCISQTSLDEKQAGISQIPAVLESSGTLVVLLSEQYFQRLWCCYEMAVFAASGRQTSIEIIPLRPVLLVVVMTVFDLLSAVLFRSSFRSSLAEDNIVIFIVVSSAFAAITAALAYGFSYLWFKDLERVRQQLSAFTLDRVACSDPADRVALTADIAVRFNGVENFEKFVQTQVLIEIASRPRVKYLAFVCLPTLFALAGYLAIITQRMGFFCLRSIDATSIVFRDDSFCSVLDRETYENIIIIIAEIASTICYYPVVVRAILAFINFTLRFKPIARALMHTGGYLVVAVSTAVTPGQFDNALIAHSVKAGVLVTLAFIFVIIPRRSRAAVSIPRIDVQVKKIE